MSVELRWLGRVPYERAHRAQSERREAVLRGQGAEALWLLEHPATITVGRRAVPNLPDASVLAALGVELHAAERGGLATWHGPGQLVGYLILDRRRLGLGVAAFVRAVEQGLIDWLRTAGVVGGRRAGLPGVWVGHDKVAAVGFHFRKGVSMHGFSLNLSADLSGYSLIVPCGITDGGVTTVQRVVGQAPPLSDVALEVGSHVLSALDRSRVDASAGCG